MPSRFTCGVIFLAAGGSQRMGEPKQLLPIGDRHLLRSVLEATLCPQLSPAIVVLGANAAVMQPSLTGLPVQIMFNDHWREGISSSIRAGMNALLRVAPRIDGVIISLADQRCLSASHMRQLIDTHYRTSRTIIASNWSGILTPPTLFTSIHFGKLITLQGETGARSVLRDNQEEVAVVAFNDLGDIDTPYDYAEYLRGQPNV